MSCLKRVYTFQNSENHLNKNKKIVYNSVTNTFSFIREPTEVCVVFYYLYKHPFLEVLQVLSRIDSTL